MKNIDQLLEKLTDIIKQLKRYAPLLFCGLLVLLYGFLFYRIHVLDHAAPSASTTTQAKAAQVPRIDPDVVKQLKNLQDNSVSVKALFDQARSNPFQEEQPQP